MAKRQGHNCISLLSALDFTSAHFQAGLMPEVSDSFLSYRTTSKP